MIFERCVGIILDIEGGLVADPSDPGGETKYGISKRSYPNLDIANLTVQQATDIYYKDFWTPCRCSTFPSGMDLMLLDAAVNQGVGGAIEMLQESLGVAIDGVFGPQTIAAYQRQGISLQEYAAMRMLRYGRNPQFPNYGRGWSRRLMRVMSSALLMK